MVGDILKIAYIGIDLFLPVLKELIKCGCEVLEIFTCKTDNITEFNTGIIELAEINNITYTLDRIKISDFIRLKEKNCEAVICAGYYYKIPVFHEIPTVNIHPTLLPYGRGPWPMPYDILNERKEGGVTVHKVEEGFDEGDILMQTDFSISSEETHETLMEKVYEKLSYMIPDLVKNFLYYYNNAIPQKEGVYLPEPDENMYTILPDMNVETADRILRAFYGYICYYKENNVKHALLKARAIKNSNCQDYHDKAVFSLCDGVVVANTKGCR